MALKIITPLTDKQQAVLEEVVARRGVVFSGPGQNDYKKIAEAAGCTDMYVRDLLNKNQRFLEALNERLADLPLNNDPQQIGYLQAMLDEKLARRKMADLPMTDKDPVDIIEAARRVRNAKNAAPHTQVNIQQNVMTDQRFEHLDNQQLFDLLKQVKSALSGSQEVIDVDFSDAE